MAQSRLRERVLQLLSICARILVAQVFTKLGELLGPLVVEKKARLVAADGRCDVRPVRRLVGAKGEAEEHMWPLPLCRAARLCTVFEARGEDKRFVRSVAILL